MRQLEYSIAVKLKVNGDDTSPVTTLVETIKSAGGTAEIKTIKPVRVPREDKPATGTATAPAAE
jgi:hypothetical protein